MIKAGGGGGSSAEGPTYLPRIKKRKSLLFYILYNNDILYIMHIIVYYIYPLDIYYFLKETLYSIYNVATIM